MKRLARTISLLILAALTATLFALSSAGAATVLQMDMPTLVSNSDTIVIAEVTEVRARQEADGRVYSTITLEVDEALKGEPGRTVTVRQIGGRDLEADIATYVPGMPTFEPGERLFLFLATSPDQTSVVTGMTQGKFQIAEGPDEQTRFVVPQVRDLHHPHRSASPPDAPPHQTAPPGVTQLRELGLFDQVHEFSAFRQFVEAEIEAQDGEQ